MSIRGKRTRLGISWLVSPSPCSRGLRCWCSSHWIGTTQIRTPVVQSIMQHHYDQEQQQQQMSLHSGPSFIPTLRPSPSPLSPTPFCVLGHKRSLGAQLSAINHVFMPGVKYEQATGLRAPTSLTFAHSTFVNHYCSIYWTNYNPRCQTVTSNLQSYSSVAWALRLPLFIYLSVYLTDPEKTAFPIDFVHCANNSVGTCLYCAALWSHCIVFLGQLM